MEQLEYYKGYDQYFWRWEEQGEVLAIPDAETIAYKAYVGDLLIKLAPQGLPPFGSLLLAILATNPNGEGSVNNVFALMNERLADSNSTREPLNSAIGFLKMLSGLPRKYKEGNLRQLLFQTLFQDSHNILSADKSHTIAVQFNKEEQASGWDKPESRFSANVYNTDFKTISLLYRKYPDINSIIQRLADIPVIEEEVILEKADETLVTEKDFLQQLTENTQTFHVASLVKSLWSGLNIPHHNLLPSQQTVGGVSDLTNKGQFDRLLISEYANDDTVLLSRLANNEALYINREIPPENNDLQRIILIDVSIKNWGTPKTIAHSIALAIASHPKTDIHCSVFAVGEHCYPLQIHSVDALIMSLLVMDPCLDASIGLAEFFKDYKFKNCQIFYIASVENFRQPAIHKVISEHYNSFNYWIHTDDEGCIDVYKRQQNSKKHVQHLSLPLNVLWKKPPLPVQAKGEPSGTIEIAPLLYPLPLNPRKKIVTLDKKIFLVTAEKDLMTPGGNNKGGFILYRDLPSHRHNIEIGCIGKSHYQVCSFDLASKEITIIDLATKERKAMVLTNEYARNSSFIFYEGEFYKDSQTSFQLTSDGINVQQHYLDIVALAKTKEDLIQQLHYSVTSGSILKNVTTVFINNSGNLVLNKHRFSLTSSRVFKFEISDSMDVQVEGKESGDGEFCFPDGSMVTIDRAGMIILQSSDLSLDIIYIPSVLGISLGIGTRSHFSGNEYFRPVDSITQVLRPGDFNEKYIQQFIKVIVNGT